jgi:triacylglycerol lipase
MRIAYDRKMVELLADCCLRAYQQFAKGHVIPPPGYTVVAEFKASFTLLNLLLARLNHWTLRLLRWILLPLIWLLDVSGLFRKPFGFALVSRKGDHYIIAFRGTQDLEDWFTDADAFQTTLSRRLRGDAHTLDKTRVHQGFQLLAVSLSHKVYEAAKGFKPKVPIYVTGHSLGGAVAALTALMVKARLKRPEVRMYSYAAPRVGDPVFVAAYDALIPGSYRVVNLADVIPVVPPLEFRGWRYGDIGEEWAFLNQSGDIVGNHSIDARDNYITACKKRVPSDKRRKYPISAV